MIPLLAASLTPAGLEGPLRGIHTLDSGSDGQIFQLVENSASHLKVEQQPAPTFIRHVNNLKELASSEVVGPDESPAISPASPGPENSTALQGEAKVSRPSPLSDLSDFCTTAYEYWEEQIVADEPAYSPARFPHGHYEMGFALVDAVPADGLVELQNRLKAARGTKHSGWPPFLELQIDGWEPYARDNFIEAWTGRRVSGKQTKESVFSDFWRVSAGGQLYTIRGYVENNTWMNGPRYSPGKALDFDFPIAQIVEGILFARRLAKSFERVKGIAVRGRFTGLEGRSLLFPTSPIGVLWKSNYISRSRSVDIPVKQVTLAQVQDQDALAKVILELLKGFYARFNFYKLSLGEVQRVIGKLGRF